MVKQISGFCLLNLHKLLCPVGGKTAATTKHTGRQVLDRERHGIRGSSFPLRNKYTVEVCIVERR
jgi:hypothetical protein